MAQRSASKHFRKSTNDLYEEPADNSGRFKTMYNQAFVDHSSRKRNEGIGRYEKGVTSPIKRPANFLEARSPNAGDM